MGNPLFNRFGGNNFATMNNNNNIGSVAPNKGSGNGLLNILNQYRQIQNDPGKILDLLFSNGKIN